MSESQLIDNSGRRRFELALEDGAMAFIDYQRRGDGVLVLTHAEVPVERRGAGIGARLTQGVLELVQARGERVVPSCLYIAQFISRHPQYRDLVAGASELTARPAPGAR